MNINSENEAVHSGVLAPAPLYRGKGDDSDDCQKDQQPSAQPSQEPVREEPELASGTSTEQLPKSEADLTTIDASSSKLENDGAANSATPAEQISEANEQSVGDAEDERKEEAVNASSMRLEDGEATISTTPEVQISGVPEQSARDAEEETSGETEAAMDLKVSSVSHWSVSECTEFTLTDILSSSADGSFCWTEDQQRIGEVCRERRKQRTWINACCLKPFLIRFVLLAVAGDVEDC